MPIAVFHERHEEDVDWHEGACEKGDGNAKDRGERGTQFLVMVTLVETHVQRREDQNQLKQNKQSSYSGNYWIW